MADRAALEMLCTARYRGFESRPLRHHLSHLVAIEICYKQFGVNLRMKSEKELETTSTTQIED